MSIRVRAFQPGDLAAMQAIWNRVVDDAVAFPQEEGLSLSGAGEFFAAQSFSAVAEDTETGEILGLYILHPNNIGRCGHIGNASYAVRADVRNRHVGECLVRDCLARCRECGFRVLQFNAVVSSNSNAIHLYEKLGFVRLGTIPGGFRLADGSYEDIIVFYHKITEEVSP